MSIFHMYIVQGYKPEHMRQHETVGQTVSHIEVGAKGVGQSVHLGYIVISSIIK